MTVTPHIDTARPVATLINVFTVSPDRQPELIDLLARATEETMKHQPGFICANFHASQDGEHQPTAAESETTRRQVSSRKRRVHDGGNRR
ncbi:antibiotic biosynthesis monooxygenase [Streptomyces sp. NPDC051133]|uniref:antibiotic biosynthesis monooxygenase n=1 Tax=Streptomyces sp. NPDC051133 TaxID=3155521 RepID=UPI0034212E3A